jgi:hypothetical protein
VTTRSSGIHRIFAQHKVYLTLISHRGDHTHSFTLCRQINSWGSAYWCIAATIIAAIEKAGEGPNFQTLPFFKKEKKLLTPKIGCVMSTYITHYEAYFGQSIHRTYIVKNQD